MGKKKPTREEALALLQEYNKNDALRKHALAVEAVMAHFAQKFGEDEEKWRVIGLVHDLDYEQFPHAHCRKVREILLEKSWPEDYIKAVQSHGWKLCSDVEPQERMEKVLYAVDELTGLINATALLRPGRSILGLTAESVKKKWKQKGFAAGVNRQIVEEGAKLLGMELTELIAETIQGMQNVAEELGLKGDL